ncbi:MAG: DUF4215 domain-containing protein [Candidatus Binatia bacterium]
MTFGLEDDVVPGSLQWETDYSEAPGYFHPGGGNVQCLSLVDDVLTGFTNIEDASILDQGMISLDGFQGPVSVSACLFKASATPAKADFDVTVNEASDPDLRPIVPLPSVGIESIDCEVTPVVCGDRFVEADEQCDDGNSNTADACPNTCNTAFCGDGYLHDGFEHCDDGNTLDGDGCSSLCILEPICGDATGDRKIFASDALRILQRAVGTDVECPTWTCNVDGVNGVSASDALRILRRSVDIPVELDCGVPTALVVRITTSASLGALQLNIGYQDVAGEIDGSGPEVNCEALQPGTESAFNDKPERILAASFVSLSGIHGPGAIARCGFTPGGTVTPENFAVTVLDAKTKNGSTAAQPGVRVVPD